MIISLDKYKKTGHLKPEEELHIELTENGVFEYLPSEGSVYNKAIVIVNVTSAEPEPEPGETPEISFTGLTLYPGVEYMMVGETYDMTFETDYEPGTYEIFTQQYPVEVDYDNKVLRITPTDSGFTEFCMYNYNGDIYEGERYLEVQVPAKYKAQVDIGVLEFTSNYCVNYEISEEVENYWFEIDNCAVETNQEEKCIYVTPEYNGVLTDSNNVRLCWDSNVGVCHATLNELPPFTVPEDFPAVLAPAASSWVNGDTVIVEASCYPLGEGRPMPNIEIFNGGQLVYKPLNFDGWLSATIPTSDLTADYFEISVIADYNGNSYSLMGIWVPIDGWEDKPENYISDVDTAIWGNPDDAIPVTMAEFVAAEPISINTETGEVSNAQWYEITGKILSAGVENGRFWLQSIDGDCEQNIYNFENSILICSSNNNIAMMEPIGNGDGWFPGDDVDIKIRTLKHNYDYYNQQDHELSESDHGKTIGGSYKGSPCAVYIGTIGEASGPDNFPTNIIFNDVGAEYNADDDTVIIKYDINVEEENRPLPRLILYNANDVEIRELPIDNYNNGEYNQVVIDRTDDITPDLFIRGMGDFNGESFMMFENSLYIVGFPEPEQL